MALPGSDIATRTAMQMDAEYMMHFIGRLPIAFVRGEGMKLWDAEGREYLDFLAGIAVNGLGHCPPAVVSAICEQAATLMHVSNLYYIPQQAVLAKRLTELSGLGKAFFCNSGAEANEAAIKLARKWTKENRGEGRYEIITTMGSFHGRTLTTVTATGQPKYHHGFEPLVPGFKYVPYNDLPALQAAVTDKTCAIMLEPIQGESGVFPASREYLRGIRELCDRHGPLLILDEIQTGLGRTGKWFGFQHYDVMPDIMTLAKTLAGGFPMGACLASNDVATGFQPGNHSSTFGGNPLACAAAIAAVDAIDRDGLVENSADVGAYFKQRLEVLKADREDIAEVRGMGLMIGITLARKDAARIGAACLENGLILNWIGESILRFLPPLIVRKEHVDTALGILNKALSESAA